MKWLKTTQIVSVLTSNAILLDFRSKAERDAAFLDLERQQRDPVQEPPRAADVAQLLDMLAVIHATASVPNVSHQVARGHLIYIVGIVHGLIRNLGGTPPAIPDGFFGQRLGDGQIVQRPPL